MSRQEVELLEPAMFRGSDNRGWRRGVWTYVLNEGALVLEGVTLGGVVELVVQVLVDLAAGTVLD